jgi:hypothetical protein
MDPGAALLSSLLCYSSGMTWILLLLSLSFFSFSPLQNRILEGYIRLPFIGAFGMRLHDIGI